MKKLNLLMIALLGLTIYLNSCKEDEIVKINSSAAAGTATFALNAPAYSNSSFQYVLEKSSSSTIMETLTCTQPDYGFTASVTYTPEVSLSENGFSVQSSFRSLTKQTTPQKVDLYQFDVNNAINELFGDNFPATGTAVDLYIRLKANISSAMESPLDSTLKVKSCYSNVIKIKTLPYKAASLLPYYKVKNGVKTWYLIGGAIGDGTWHNSQADVGISLIPLSIVPGNAYNENGDGEFIYTGYFETGKGFKVIKTVGAWDYQFGNTGSEGIDKPRTKQSETADPSNFVVPENGYYTVWINSITNICKIYKASTPSAIYAKMGLVGNPMGWGNDVFMTPIQATNSHVWYLTYSFTKADEIKFRADASWGANWGGDYFPTGLGVAGSPNNLKNEAGTYKIIFDDITSCYYFIKQ